MFRKLRAEEKADARIVYKTSVPLDDVQVFEGSFVSGMSDWFRDEAVAVTTMRIIHLPENFDTTTKRNRHTLIHELGHVWQGENTGPYYMGHSLFAQGTQGNSAYNYGGTGALTANTTAGGKLDNFNPEQQAQIMADYFQAKKDGQHDAATTRTSRRCRRLDAVMPPGGGTGEPEDSPDRARRCEASAAARRGPAGETGFPPRDRADGEGGGVTFVVAARASGPRAAPAAPARARAAARGAGGRAGAGRGAVRGGRGRRRAAARRRSPARPRTALPGPFLVDPSGRAVPAGWLPDLGPGLEVFAKAAARVQRRAGPPGPLAVLGQWEPRYLQLAGRLEANLCRGGEPPFPVLRWTSERITRSRPRQRPAAGARHRHLLRARPAEGLGRVPRPAGPPPRRSGRRAARRALLGHLPDGEPPPRRPLLLRSRRHRRRRSSGSRRGRRRRPCRQHALDARPRRRTSLGRVPAGTGAARRFDAARSRGRRTASSATRSRSSREPPRAPDAPSASSRRRRSSQLDWGRDRGRAPRDRRRGRGARARFDRPERNARRRGCRLVDGDGDRSRRRAALRAQLHGRGAEGDHDLRQPRRADAGHGWPSRRPHRAGGNHRSRRRLARRRGRRDLLGLSARGDDGCGPGRIVRHL